MNARACIVVMYIFFRIFWLLVTLSHSLFLDILISENNETTFFQGGY